MKIISELYCKNLEYEHRQKEFLEAEDEKTLPPSNKIF
jgi:hypothetical protein